jgi:hypothetical protein
MRCEEASAVQAYQVRGLSLALGMEIGYVIKGMHPEASEFDAMLYGKLHLSEQFAPFFVIIINIFLTYLRSYVPAMQ